PRSARLGRIRTAPQSERPPFQWRGGHTRGVGAAGSPEAADDLRSGVHGAARPNEDGAPILVDLPHASRARDGRAHRACGLPPRGGARRLRRPPVGPARRRLDSHRTPALIGAATRLKALCAKHLASTPRDRSGPVVMVRWPAMSGHSKWHTIKHKKGAADAKRGKLFTRIIKELTVAARTGGGDPDTNPRLRTIVAEAKSVNMPADNIKRAIRRGTGEEEGVSYDEVTYEGYGPGGAAVMVDTLTDNRNRTVGELRHLFGKYGGNLGETNSVGWMFERKGQITVDKSKADEESLMAVVLDAGADDMSDDGSAWQILTSVEAFNGVTEALKAAGVEPDSAQLAMVPQNFVKLEGKVAQQMLKLMEALEDHDDTKSVWSNFDIEEKEIEASLA